MLCSVPADAVHDYRTRGYAVLRGCIAPAQLEAARKMVGEVSALAGAIHVHELLPSGEVALARTEDFAARHEGMAQLLSKAVLGCDEAEATLDPIPSPEWALTRPA